MLSFFTQDSQSGRMALTSSARGEARGERPPGSPEPPRSAQAALAGLVNRFAAPRFAFCFAFAFASLQLGFASLRFAFRFASLRFSSLFESNRIEFRSPHADRVGGYMYMCIVASSTSSCACQLDAFLIHLYVPYVIVIIIAGLLLLRNLVICVLGQSAGERAVVWSTKHSTQPLCPKRSCSPCQRPIIGSDVRRDQVDTLTTSRESLVPQFRAKF